MDITFFRQDLGLETDIDALKKLSRKQQGKHIDQIKQAAQNYIHGDFKTRLQEKIKTIYQQTNADIENLLVADENDSQQQTLLIHYP